MSNAIAQLIIIFILTLINAFLAASELAILSSNKTKLIARANEGDKRAKLVLKLQEDETKLLSTIQVGITLSGFFSSATASVSLSKGMAHALSAMNVPFANELSLVTMTLILSYFTLVFGELFPKRIALRNPEKIAINLSYPILIIRFVFKPIVLILSLSCNLLSKLFKIDSKKEDVVTENEVIALINEAVDDGSIKEEEQEMIENVILFDNLIVKNIMVPRVDVFMININSSVSKIKKNLKKEKYTRVPVFQGNRDNVIGIINIKDVFFYLKNDFTIDEIKNILRKPLFVVETMKVYSLFLKFKDNHEHSAVVVDENGSFSGYITLEDIIEEITGNIYDEHDEKLKLIEKIDENNFIVNASILIQDLNRALNINIKLSSDYHTLAGFIQHNLKVVAREHDKCYSKINNLRIEVLQVQNKRVVLAKLTIEEKM